MRRAFSTLQIGLARALQGGSQALGPWAQGGPRSGQGVRGVRGVRHMASNSGYDAQFVDLPDHLTCPICCTGLRAPQLTRCGHRFCEPCLEVVRRKDRSLACPVCREELTSNQVYPDNACKRDVLNLQVKCDQLEAGCTWIGDLRQLQNPYMRLRSSSMSIRLQRENCTSKNQ